MLGVRVIPSRLRHQKIRIPEKIRVSSTMPIRIPGRFRIVRRRRTAKAKHPIQARPARIPTRPRPSARSSSTNFSRIRTLVKKSGSSSEIPESRKSNLQDGKSKTPQERRTRFQKPRSSRLEDSSLSMVQRHPSLSIMPERKASSFCFQTEVPRTRYLMTEPIKTSHSHARTREHSSRHIPRPGVP